MNSKNSVVKSNMSEKKYGKKFCGFIATKLLTFMNFVNFFTKFCFERSHYSEKIEDTLSDLHSDIDVGKKVKAYDKGVYDVISEPIKTMSELKDENSKNKISLTECELFVYELYALWKAKDYENIDKMFVKYEAKMKTK